MAKKVDSKHSGASKGSHKPKAKPPSWFKPGSSVVADKQAAAAPATPAKSEVNTAKEPIAESVKEPAAAPVAEPVKEPVADLGAGAEVLLGAPCLDGGADDLLCGSAVSASGPVAEATPAHDVSRVTAAVAPEDNGTADTKMEPVAVKAEPVSTGYQAQEKFAYGADLSDEVPEHLRLDKAVPATRTPTPAAKEPDRDDAAEAARMAVEAERLLSIVQQVESLEYLSPRLRRVVADGCRPADMVGLYRMAVNVLFDNMLKQAETLSKIRSASDKRLRQLEEEMLFTQSANLVKVAREGGQLPPNPYASPQPGQMSSDSQPTHSGDSEASAASFPQSAGKEAAKVEMLRKQMQIKDDLLLKARVEAEEAEKRCEKMTQDVKNIRSRMEKDLALKLQRAKESLFNKLVLVLDSFDGALASKDSFKDVDSVVQGLQGIHDQLLHSCQSEGLEPIAVSKGRPFDPNLHESCGQVETNEVPEESIYDEVRRGYTLNEKLLRASMVLTAKAASSAEPVASAQENQGPSPEEKAALEDVNCIVAQASEGL